MFESRENRRGFSERFLEREHAKIQDIFGGTYGEVSNRYLSKFNIVPHYPKRVEFHLSKVKHVTTKSRLDRIINSDECGFRSEPCNGRHFSWWSLDVEDDDISFAEQQFLQAQFPERTPDAQPIQEPFLSTFTKSPAFQKGSRYGNFKFTFSLGDLLRQYSHQFCGGAQPKLKVYETVLYRQEILYTVVVHSPDVQDFGDDSLSLKTKGSPVDNRGIVWLDEEQNKIIWSPEAMCDTIDHRLYMDTDRQIFTTEELSGAGTEYYLWDNVALAFHVGPGKVLQFEKKQLIRSLSACAMIEPKLGYDIGLENAEREVNTFKESIGVV